MVRLVPPSPPRPSVRVTPPIAIMLAGYGGLAIVLGLASVRGTQDPWPLILSVVIVALLAGFSVDAFGGAGTSFNVNDFMYLGIAFAYGPLGCLCASAADISARKIMGPFDWFRTAFNFLNFFVSSWAAWFVYSQLAPHGSISWRSGAVGILAGFVLFAVQNIPIVYLIHIIRRAPILPAFRSLFAELLPYDLGYGWAALSFVFMYHTLGFLGIAFIVAPVLLLQGFLVYLARRVHLHASEIAEQHRQRLNLLQDLVVKQRGFVADAAHELRTPLTTMSGGLEIMQLVPGMAVEQRLEIVSDALQESRRLSNLVDSLLELSTLDAGEQTKQVSFELSPWIDQVTHDLKRRIDPRQLDVRIGDALGKFVGDSKRLSRMMELLGDNIAAHTPAVSSAIFTVRREDDGSIYIALEDDGPGILSDMLDRVFDRFVQIDPSRHDARPGMGLAIAKSIAITHRGNIFSEKMIPRGLRIVATFPFEVAIGDDNTTNTKPHDLNQIIE